ncbi:MAG: autotransporter outer membrane beta-barrel domain-containing protein, partial [Verrucomicrobiales bacterium]|nr:autotransporter outer membrane beta-barrel domain-containing protein [Verrucomicrobiales bacterium]
MNTPNMKPPLKKLTLLLTLLPALTLTARAQNLVITSDTTVSGTHYENNGANYAALTNSNTWTFTGSDVTLTGTAASGNGQDGARFTVGGTLNLSSGTINANRYGIYLLNTSAAAVNDTIITTAGNSGAHAINASGTSTLTVTGGTITTTGSRSIGVRAENFASVSLSGATVITVGDGAYAVGAYNNTTLDITGGVITATGSDGRGVRSQDSFATLTDTVLAATGAGEHSYGFHLAVTGTAILNNVKITARETALAVTGSAGEHPVLIINGGSFVAGRNALTLGSDMDAAALITITGADLVAPLLINTDILEDNSIAAAELAITDSTLAGDIVGNASSTLAINLNRSPLTGNITGNDHATIDVTLSGTGSTLLGDINQNDDAAVTITIDHSATGRGGFNGGNLITGGDSAWTFNKNSHGNYGENHGSWNLGDYDITFDNMIHTGTINISVNSDTGAGGSITITDTADGDGTVHIDATGNGKVDPNQVLPGIVSGDGTEHWQWDPIDWGIDTIIKNGDHFIKQGTSPAGAVLNSSVAIQQAMWFAQQNSLLKRMGDLRYGARASRPLAGETPAFHNLIDNLWLRSYGQQLNIGSQVAGKAYEQLIYGIDLGTDHKFTISADSDLYLGVYAGYGRSDIDYRTPGTDGELNSYYGGLYATWLHSSGFYIDATIKAANVDNDLKAPYGTTQLTASYSDVNLGGSLEIGKKFTFSDAWFIEPQFQVNYL